MPPLRLHRGRREPGHRTLQRRSRAGSACARLEGDARTKDEALIQMTMRWLEAEAYLQKSVPLDAVEKLRDEVLERTSLDMRGTVDRLFAEVVSKTVRR